MIRENSKIAHESIKDTKVSAKGEVFGAIHSLGKATRQDVATRLGWQINRVTGRVKELLDAGVIEECGTVRVDNRPRALLRVRYREAVQQDLWREAS